jgi:uncharacterized membrane-anchored protein YjiN (DUF445 family)
MLSQGHNAEATFPGSFLTRFRPAFRPDSFQSSMTSKSEQRPPDMDPDHEKRMRLRRMKWIAHGFLVGAALLFAIASLLEDRHPAMGYVAAFAEAAMVGAIADWFAVVALFRHPLGLRFIPHTAIIPANRARIADNLGDFVQGEFFSTQRIMAVVRELNPASHAAAWLAQPRNASELADLATRGAGYLLAHTDTAQASAWLRDRIAENSEKIDVASWTAAVLDMATASGRHQMILDQMLHAVDTMLAKPHVRERVEQMLAEALPLYFDALKLVGGRIAAERMVASLQKLFEEIASDPDHELRHRFNHTIAVFIERLRSDPVFREGIAEYVNETIRNPAFAGYIDSILHDAVQWTERDLRHPASRTRSIMANVIGRVATALEQDAVLADWINERITQSAPPIIERYRPRLGAFISHKMHEWKDEEIVDKLELQIGRDLQFIRLNGTIVGGLAGLVIHTAGQWLVG